MSKLTTLKTVATADLAAAKSTVASYVAELESAVSTNKLLVIGVGVAAFVVGAAVGHLI